MPQGGLDKKALGAAGPLLGGCAAFLVALLLVSPSSLCGNPAESDKELFLRVCTFCHGWAVENFLVTEGTVEGMEPICPPPYENWLPIVLSVATYQVKVEGEKETNALIPRKDLLRLVNYINENYPKEPICAKTWKEDTK